MVELSIDKHFGEFVEKAGIIEDISLNQITDYKGVYADIKIK